MAKPERIHPKDMPERQPPKRELKMRQIVRQLQITPIPQIACERAGVSRATYYRWRAIDFVFARAADHALEEGRFLVNDMAESQLVRKVKSGDGSSIRYWLSHNSPRYSRKEIHEHDQYCETRSVEEKHRDMRRDGLRNLEIFGRGVNDNNVIGDFNDRQERDVHEEEDWMFERFEMLNDDTATEEPHDQNKPENQS